MICFSEVLKQLKAFLVAQIEILFATFFLLMGLLFFSPLTFGAIFSLPSSSNWLWLTASGLLSFLGGNYNSFANLKKTNTINNSLLSPVITVITSLLAFVILDESIGWLGIIGLTITVSAVFAYQYKQVTNNLTLQGFYNGVICIAFISISIICAIKGTVQSNLSLFHSMFLKLFPCFICVLLVQLFNKKRIYADYKLINLKNGMLLIGAIVFQTILASYLWFIASFQLGVSKFQVIVSLFPFVVAFLQVKFYKKSDLSLRFYITAIIAFIGVLLLFI